MHGISFGPIIFIWFHYKIPALSEFEYTTPLAEIRKLFLVNLGRLPFLAGILHGFRITSQASCHKARKHKLQRCRFRAAISAMFNYRCVCLSNKENLFMDEIYRIFLVFSTFFSGYFSSMLILSNLIIFLCGSLVPLRLIYETHFKEIILYFC
jgi:hypothetical protein